MQGLFLRFTIDKEEGITLDDCERYHKTVQPYTEQVEFDYMEVSSPGADRPLKSQADFDRAVGKRVELKLYKAEQGAKLHTGALVGLENGQISLTTDQGTTLSFSEKSVALVRPLVEFSEEDLQDETAVPEDSDR